jgi:spore coat protein CotH
MKVSLAVFLTLFLSPVLQAVEPLTADTLFAHDHLMQVEVTMDPDDWQALRISHRETGENFSQIVEKPYEYYSATAVIDGREIGEVATRPSLKLKLDYVDEGKEFAGQDRLTFNNNNQDPTRAQTVLVYQFMNDAGVFSPRSNLARIVVNGEDLGVYTHVESVRKPFIKRLFGKSKGDLWEGYAGDFTESEYENPEPIALEGVEKLLDLDAFITLWATEVLIGHWDGYASNRNNYYIFRPKKTGLFYFTPWGVPKSFKARGYLCERLWELPEVRGRYRKEMQRLLDDVWDEKKMLAQLRQVRTLTKDSLTVPEAAVEKSSRSIVEFIETRRADVQAELDLPATDWPDLGGKFKPGSGKRMQVRGEFQSVFTVPAEKLVAEGENDSALFSSVPASLHGTGQANLEFTVDGETSQPFTHFGVRTTPGNPDFIRKGYPVIELIASSDAGHPPWRLLLIMDPYQLVEGANQLEIDHFTVWAQLTQGEPGSESEQKARFGISGTLDLEEFSKEPGAAVSGRFNLNMGAFKAVEN